MLAQSRAYTAHTYRIRVKRDEDRYTNAVGAGRAVVERAIGSLKRKFFMLHHGVRYEPEHTEAPSDTAAGAAMRQHIIDTYFS
ncbi:hypothetical protein Aduo_005187 [Ancylostoma duodenale]